MNANGPRRPEPPTRCAPQAEGTHAALMNAPRPAGLWVGPHAPPAPRARFVSLWITVPPASLNGLGGAVLSPIATENGRRICPRSDAPHPIQGPVSPQNRLRAAGDLAAAVPIFPSRDARFFQPGRKRKCTDGLAQFSTLATALNTWSVWPSYARSVWPVLDNQSPQRRRIEPLRHTYSMSTGQL